MHLQSHYISSFPPYLLPKQYATGTQQRTVENNNARTYIHPVITKEDHKKSMDNYRLYVNALNHRIKALNKEIRVYNKKVDSHTRKQPPGSTKKVLINTFLKKFTTNDIPNYNEAARSFNENHGNYIKQVTLPTVKAATELVFSAFLHAYTVELQRYVSIWKKIDKITPSSLPKASINPHKITQQQRNGVASLNMCKRTIRNHKKRMEDAGILVDKHFRGSQIPVNYLFNPSIICISEGFSSETTLTENQQVNPKKRKDLQDVYNVSSTKSERNEIEKKGIVNNSDNMENAAHLPYDLSFYKITKTQDKKSNSPGARKNVKKTVAGSKTRAAITQTGAEVLKNAGLTSKNEAAAIDHQHSERKKWRKKIINRFDLAALIASGAMNNYTPISPQQLAWLRENNVLDSEEFRELCLQDFIKDAAKINKHHQAGAGSWGQAIKYIDADFNCRNYKGSATSKIDCYNKLMEFRYRLRRALSWFSNNDWKNVRYASDYFNPLFTDPKYVGWAYTKKFWKKAMHQKQIAADKKRANLKTARLRKEKMKLDRYIYQFLRGEKTLIQTTELVIKLPLEVRENYNQRLQELTNRRLTKHRKL